MKVPENYPTYVPAVGSHQPVGYEKQSNPVQAVVNPNQQVTFDPTVGSPDQQRSKARVQQPQVQVSQSMNWYLNLLRGAQLGVNAPQNPSRKMETPMFATPSLVQQKDYLNQQNQPNQPIVTPTLAEQKDYLNQQNQPAIPGQPSTGQWEGLIQRNAPIPWQTQRVQLNKAQTDYQRQLDALGFAQDFGKHYSTGSVGYTRVPQAAAQAKTGGSGYPWYSYGSGWGSGGGYGGGYGSSASKWFLGLLNFKI